MKIVIASAMLVLMMISCTASCNKRPIHTSEPVSMPPMTFSIETGKLSSRPGCKPEVDGCAPKIWTAARDFQAGSTVWLTVTIMNHTNLYLGWDDSWLGPRFEINLVDQATNEPPRPTRFGCWLMGEKCPLAANDPNRGDVPWDAMRLEERTLVPPQSSMSRVELIDSVFEVTKPGTYTVSVGARGLFLTNSKADPHSPSYDEKREPRGVEQPVETVQSNSVQFTVFK